MYTIIKKLEVLKFKKIYENDLIKAYLISSTYRENYTEQDFTPLTSLSFPLHNGFLYKTKSFNKFISTNSILFEKNNVEFSISKFKCFGTDTTLSFQFKNDTWNEKYQKNKNVSNFKRHPKLNKLISAFLSYSKLNHCLYKEELIENILLSDFSPIENQNPKVINHQKIERAKDFIDRYYKENITVNDISKNCHLSSFHFSRIFKTQTGFSPYDYLLKTRIEKSKKLLIDNFTINQIAYDTGFNSIEHFSYSFKKIEKLTPTEFKKSKISKIYKLL